MLRNFGRLFPLASRTPMLLSFVISTITATITFALIPWLPPQIPLFYTMAQPGLTLAPKLWITMLPALLFIFTLVNGLVSQTLRNYDPLLVRLFAWSALISQTVLALAMLRIVFIVM